jgi:probable O-glycosylation ligase (exosortase A-associated)
MLVAEIVLTALVVASLPFCFTRPWIGVLVFAWLGYMNPHRLVGGFAADLPFGKFVAAATLLGWLRGARTYSLPRTREVYLLLALGITFLCSTMLTATHPALARTKLIEVSKILLMTGVTMALFRDRRRLHVLLLVMALSIGCLGFAGGVWALRTRWPTILWGPADSGIGDNNAFGFALTMVLPLLALLRDEESRRWVRSVLLAMFGLSIVAIFATYSRGSFIGLLVVLTVMVAKRRTRDVALLAVMAAALATVVIAPPQWWARIASITLTAYEDDPSGYHRMRSWYVAFRTGLDHPVLGAGFWPFDVELYQRYLPGYVDFHDAHNHFLQVFAEHGFTGLILFAALLACVFRGLRRVMRTTRGDPARRWMSHYADVVEVSLVAYTVGGVFLNMAYFDLMYQLIAVAVILECEAGVEAPVANSSPKPPSLGKRRGLEEHQFQFSGSPSLPQEGG